jgi:4-amino-4-deoxy-L-arabinose transferase-like glycosyltransferase
MTTRLRPTRVTLVSSLSTLKKHRGFFVLIAFAATLFLSDIWAYKEFVRAESYFALGARSMVERNEWLTPHAPDELQLNKPPLTYWLIGVSYKLFGSSYGSARLPSVLAAILVLAIVYGLGTWLDGVQVGLISAAILASSYLFLTFARIAMSDMLLTLCVTAGFACFIAALTERTNRSRKVVLVGYVALALGVLAKGPVALALVAVPIGLELLVRRDREMFKRLRLPIGLALFLAIAAPYFLLVSARAGVGPLQFFFVSENLQRFTGQVYESGARPFWYELAAFLSDFAPWSLLILPAALFDWRARRSGATGRPRRILYLWLIYTVLLFSLASFKRDYYLLPAMPAAALIAGPLLANTERLSEFARRALAAFLVLCSVVIVAVALISLKAAAGFSVQISLRFLPLVVSLIGMGALVVYLWRKRVWQAAMALNITIWATMFTMQMILVPAFAHFLPATYLVSRVPNGSVLYTSRAANDWANSLAFNLPPPHVVERIMGDLNDPIRNDQDLLAALGSDPRAVAVIWDREYPGLSKYDPGLRIIAQVETYGHGGLSLNLIRHPQRQRLLLVGH